MLPIKTSKSCSIIQSTCLIYQACQTIILEALLQSVNKSTRIMINFHALCADKIFHCFLTMLKHLDISHHINLRMDSGLHLQFYNEGSGHSFCKNLAITTMHQAKRYSSSWCSHGWGTGNNYAWGSMTCDFYIVTSNHTEFPKDLNFIPPPVYHQIERSSFERKPPILYYLL